MNSVNCPECGTQMLSCEYTCPMCGNTVMDSNSEYGHHYESEDELDFSDDGFFDDSI